MNWSGLAEFAAMGGYGPYVWGAFGVTAAVMAGELASLRARRRALRETADAPALRDDCREGAA